MNFPQALPCHSNHHHHYHWYPPRASYTARKFIYIFSFNPHPTQRGQSYFNLHFRDEKTSHVAHKLLLHGHRTDQMWLQSRKFKPEYAPRTNINPLDSDPSSLHCVAGFSLIGSFSFRGLESGAWKMPCCGPGRRGLVLLEDPTYHKHTPTRLLRDIRVLLSPAIWCSEPAQQDSGSRLPPPRNAAPQALPLGDAGSERGHTDSASEHEEGLRSKRTQEDQFTHLSNPPSPRVRRQPFLA